MITKAPSLGNGRLTVGSVLPHHLTGNTPRPFGVLPSAERAEPGDWTTHARSLAFAGGIVQVEALDVTAPAGDRFVQHVVRLPRVAVALVVVDGAALMLWTYRHPTGQWGYELPGGVVDDGEDPAAAAAREAAEETDLRPVGPGRPVIAFEPLPGVMTGSVHVHRWDAAEPTGEPTDPLEPGRVRWVPLADVPRLAAEGQLLGVGTLVGLLAHLVVSSPWGASCPP